MRRPISPSLILIFVLILTFLSFLPCLKSDFVNWDDGAHLLENPSLRFLDSEHLSNIFREKINKIYIPLTTLSFAFEYKFFGYNPFFYHLDNVLLHLGVVVLVFFLGRRLGLSRAGAGLAALFWGIHPIHVESVAWVTERKDVLYAVFYMAAVHCWLSYLAGRRKIFYVFSLILGILSMLAKPMAVSLPLIFLVCDWFKGRKITRSVVIEKVPYFILLGALAWVTYQEHARIPGNSLGEGILIWIWSLVFYIRQFVFPGNLLPIYHLPRPVAIFQPEYLLTLGVFLCLLWMGFRLRRKPWLLFSFAWYLGSIFFLLRFDDAADIHVVADRFMYLPSVGFCLGLAVWAQRIWRGVNLKPLVIFGCVFLAGIFSLRTFLQCQIWKNSFTLWSYQLLFYPNEPVALTNLATAYRDKPFFQKVEQDYRTLLKLEKEGLKDEAIKNREKIVHPFEFLSGLYKKAIAGDPSYEDPYYNLAKLYQDVGRLREALDLYHKVLALNPNYKDAHFNLGRLYQQLGQSAQAVASYDQTIATNLTNAEIYVNVIKAYTEALKADPTNALYRQAQRTTLERYRALPSIHPRYKESAVFYFNLGYLYQEMKEYKEAIAAYELALDLNPDYTSALYNLGNVYEQLGQVKQALFLYEKVMGLNPRHAEAYLNSGVISTRLRDYPQAIEYYEKALKVNPKLSSAYFNLGYVYEIKDEPQKAIDNYQKAVQMDPKHTEAYYNMGNVHARGRQNDRAMASYLKALEINPNHVDAWVNLSILSFREKDYEAAIKYFDEARLLGYDPPKEYARVLQKYRRLHAPGEPSLKKKED